MKTKDLKTKVAVITGAGSGIGKALALTCAKRGASLALCDVDEAGLEATGREASSIGAEVLMQRVDVAQAPAMSVFAERTHAQLGAAHLLFNNAGVGLGAGFLDTSLEDWRWIIDINLMGVVHGCHFFVPEMVRAQRGHVVNVSSGAAFVPSQSLTAYSATKAAVLGLSEAMRSELEPHGVGVTAVCPGVINTPIARSTKRRGWQDVSGAAEDGARMFERRNYSPERAAVGILDAVDRNVTVAPITPEAWAMYLARRVAPSTLPWLDARLVAQAKKRAER